MTRAQRRHDAESVFARRKKQWAATDSRRWIERGSEFDPPQNHFLKNTTRPCSCPICKQPRYQREPKHARTEQD